MSPDQTTLDRDALRDLLAPGGSPVGYPSARDYLVEALTVKNLDARGLALVLTHLPKDPVSVELQLAARMDTGHYRSIRLLDPKARRSPSCTRTLPAAAPGVLPALVQCRLPRTWRRCRTAGTSSAR